MNADENGSESICLHPRLSVAKYFFRLLTLAVSAVPAEVTAARVFELTVAFGADADHVGHDRAGDGFLLEV